MRNWLIAHLAPQPGDTVLELAAGPGGHRLCGSGARRRKRLPYPTDFSPEMVEVARRRGAELGLENVDHRTMDAERIDLDVASVDGVLCRSGYMLMPDPAVALSETRRVLRPGGRLAMSVWVPPSTTRGRRWAADSRRARPGLAAGARCARSLQHGERGAHAFVARRRRLHRRAHRRGSCRFAFTDLDDYERWVTDLSGSFAMAISGLTEPEREALREELRVAFEPFVTQEGYELGGAALTAVAS